MDLSFANISSIEAAETKFLSLAWEIMNEYDVELVKFDNKRFRISVLELYVYDERYCRDASTHKAQEQLRPGVWYLHRAGKRGLRRMGLDITAGSCDPKIYAGLLIRGIENRDGPACAVNTMLRGKTEACTWSWGVGEREFLLGAVNGVSVFEGPIRLIRSQFPRSENIFKGKRFGLSKNTEPAYRDLKWRITTLLNDRYAKEPVARSAD